MKRAIPVALACCLLIVGCSRGTLEERNQRLFDSVDASLVNDVRSKLRYRYRVSRGELTDAERIGIVRRSAETQLKELEEILKAYEPEIQFRRGPYRTSRMIRSADSELLSNLRGMIVGYRRLLVHVNSGTATLRDIDEIVGQIAGYKRRFYKVAYDLKLVRRQNGK